MLANAPVSPVLAVTDLDQAIKFYEGKLGLKRIEIPAPGLALFACGQGTRLAVYQRPGGSKAEHTVAGFLVEDIEATIKELTANGVVFEQYDMGDLKTDAMGIATLGPNKSAWFKDPEGNILSINSGPM